jgi:hypothetical protein
MVARNVLTRLVRLEGDGDHFTAATRRRLHIQELGDDPAILTFAKHFVDRRLVSSVSDGKHIYVEYIHDAVVREWKLLNVFLREDQNFLTWRQSLHDAVLVWHSHQRDHGDLFRGARLAESENWFSERGNFLTANEREFLQESIALRNQEMEKSEQIRLVEQYAQQKRQEEAEIRRRMADPQEREASTWIIALAKHRDDFHQHGTLLNSDTLALLEMQYTIPNWYSKKAIIIKYCIQPLLVTRATNGWLCWEKTGWNSSAGVV